MIPENQVGIEHLDKKIYTPHTAHSCISDDDYADIVIAGYLVASRR